MSDTETLFVTAALRPEESAVVVGRAVAAISQAAPVQQAVLMRGASQDSSQSSQAKRERAVEDELRRSFDAVEVFRFSHR